eukprot:5919672-Pyramimonas_sp.AAC.1
MTAGARPSSPAGRRRNSGFARTGFSGTRFSDLYRERPPAPFPLTGTAVTRKTPVTANLV